MKEFGVGFHEEENAQLLVWGEESEAMKIYHKTAEKYPQIDDINKWISNISKVSMKDDEEPSEEAISSEDKIE